MAIFWSRSFHFPPRKCVHLILTWIVLWLGVGKFLRYDFIWGSFLTLGDSLILVHHELMQRIRIVLCKHATGCRIILHINFVFEGKFRFHKKVTILDTFSSVTFDVSSFWVMCNSSTYMQLFSTGKSNGWMGRDVTFAHSLTRYVSLNTITFDATWSRSSYNRSTILFSLGQDRIN